ncbi:hypothetical protein LTS10_003509 [Elasticomyces elasticus]|nr:hypothetical protein LTS10_003509 [Elasticomyces elasticus]
MDPDEIEMLVASSCFGGRGDSNETGWSSMTLWVAMSEGDVYALCPLLPKRWRAPATLLPGLSTSVVSKMRAVSGDLDVGAREKRVVEQQCAFLAEVDNQEPILLPTGQDEDGYEMMEVYTRPFKPGAVPRLQGPFYMGEEIDAGEITDIFVIAAKLDDDGDVYDDDDDEYGDERDAEEGLSVGVVCLATSNGRVHICLDLEGVEAEWLPSKRSRSFTPDDDDSEKDLLLFETIDVSGGSAKEVCARFTASPGGRCELFLTTPSGVWNLDFSPWTSGLEAELASASDAGIGFRLKMLLESCKTAVERVVTILDATEGGEASTAIAVLDDEGDSYTVLTSSSSGNQPYASVLALPTPASHAYAPDNDCDYTATTTNSLAAAESRAPYEPPQAFWQGSALPQLLKTATEKKLLGPGGDKGKEVKFSPATLLVMTEAHRIMASETHRLAEGTADLFRRLERMQAELREQVRKVREVNGKVEDVVGGGEGDGEERVGGMEGEGREGRRGIEARARNAEERTKRLRDRVEGLRGRMAGLGGRGLSVKEKAFAAEVEKVERTLGDAPTPEAPVNPSALVHMENSEVERREHEEGRGETLTGRFEAVRELRHELVRQVEESVTVMNDGKGDGRGGVGVVGGGFRGRRLEEVWGLLEREGALVEGMEGRLARLGTGA